MRPRPGRRRASRPSRRAWRSPRTATSPRHVRILVGGTVTFVNVDKTESHTAETVDLPEGITDNNEFDTPHADLGRALHGDLPQAGKDQVLRLALGRDRHRRGGTRGDPAGILEQRPRTIRSRSSRSSASRSSSSAASASSSSRCSTISASARRCAWSAMNCCSSSIDAARGVGHRVVGRVQLASTSGRCPSRTGSPSRAKCRGPSAGRRRPRW